MLGFWYGRLDLVVLTRAQFLLGCETNSLPLVGSKLQRVVILKLSLQVGIGSLLLVQVRYYWR